MAFEGELKETIKTVKKIQTTLGDIHDCDVWDHYIEQFITEEKQRMVEYLGHSYTFALIQKGLEYLRGECVKRRDILFDEFVEKWNKTSKEGLWDKLRSILDTHMNKYQQSTEKTLQPDL
jgi:CHAD domain-containing protein